IVKAIAIIACGLLVVLIASLVAIRVSSGVPFWLVIGIVSIGLIWLLQRTIVSVGRMRGKEWSLLRSAQNATLVIVSTIAVLATAEGLLAFLESRAPSLAAQSEKQAKTTTPLETSSANTKTWTETELARALEEYGVQVPRSLVQQTLWRHSLLTIPLELER